MQNSAKFRFQMDKKCVSRPRVNPMHHQGLNYVKTDLSKLKLIFIFIQHQCNLSLNGLIGFFYRMIITSAGLAVNLLH